MKKLLYITFATAMLAFASCSNKSEMEGLESNGQINLKVNVGEIVEMRSNPLEPSGTTFNNDDKVSIEITEAGAEQTAKTYRYNSTLSRWTADNANYLLWTDDQLDYKAYYPVTNGTSCTTFTLPTAQNTTTGVASADYMTSSGTLTKSANDNNATIPFNRQCARVVVKIKEFGTQWSNNVVVSGVTIASGNDNIGGVATAKIDVMPYTTGTGVVGDTYTALVIPTAAKPTESFLTVRVNDNGTEKVLKYTGIPAFAKSKSYTFNLSVGYDKVELKSNFQVNDWTTGTTVDSSVPVKSAPKIGDFLYSDYDYSAKIIESRKDEIIGVVSYVSSVAGESAYAVSLDEMEDVAWSLVTDYNECSSTTNAAINMNYILAYATNSGDNRFEKFPAMDWVDAKNNKNATYDTAVKTWLLPTKEDLIRIYTNKATILSSIEKLQMTGNNVLKFDETYWSSETTDDPMNHDSNTWAQAVISSGGMTSIYKTTDTYNAVAVIPFYY